MDKRTFIKKTGLASMALMASRHASASFADLKTDKSISDLVFDETFWAEIRLQYRLNPDFINFENGYYCVMPVEIEDHYLQHVRDLNTSGSHYMRTRMEQDKTRVIARLSELAGCKPEELCITRNTTEALDMVIGGLDWQPGDEAVMAMQDYGSMLDMFDQMAEYLGVLNVKISIPLHPFSDDEIVDLYASAITGRTKLLLVSHIINITGQILPVKKIADMARSKGVLTLVDGAHAVGHFRFRIDELGCDFYGCSLHKWLSAPLGNGLLFVKSECIPLVRPLFASGKTKSTDIDRLRHTGTRPMAILLTIEKAIEFYLRLGPELKEARLRYLQNRWTSRVISKGHIILNTPQDGQRVCAIANAGVKSMSPAALEADLLHRHHIYSVAIDTAEVRGCRFTPNIYTSTNEVDALASALESYA